MSAWRVRLSGEAESDMARLDRSIRERVAEKLQKFSASFEQSLVIPLHHNLAHRFKLRIGDWRVVYLLDHEQCIVNVTAIEHRSKVYKVKK